VVQAVREAGAAADGDYRSLPLYQRAAFAATQIFALTMRLPSNERSTLGEPLLRATRAVCVQVATAGEACDLQAVAQAQEEARGLVLEARVLLDLAGRCGYLEPDEAEQLDHAYQELFDMLHRALNPAPGATW
jgi:four helix bundle protein